jgi:vitamin B12 transporter
MFTKPTKVALACAGIFATIATAQAQTNFEPIIVIASGIEQPLSKVLPSSSVITRSDLDRTQAKTLVEALQGEVGFEFGRNGGPGGTTSIFLRGSDSKNIVVMIDGVKSQTDNLGSLQLTDIPLSSVERIEILRGNGGALYGESAIGGVINIITKSGKGEPKASALVTYGSRSTSETAVGYSGEVNKTRFSINASRFDTDGFSSKKSGASINPDRDGYTNESFSGKISHQIQLGTEVGLTTQLVKGKTSYDGFYRNDDDLFQTSTNNLGIFGVTNITNQLRSRIDIQRSDFKYKDFKNGSLRTADDYADGLQTGKQTTYRLSNFFEINETQQLSFGIDKSEAQYDLVSYTNASNFRDSKGIYFGALKKIQSIDIQANVRRDELDAYRAGGQLNKYSKNTYLLGLGYQFGKIYRLTATTSTGFRAPSPAEFIGSSEIRPETNNSKEISILREFANSQTRLGIFQTKASDAITYIPESWPDRYSNMNIENRGVELSQKFSYRNSLVKFNYTHQDPVNVNLGVQQARRAKDFGSLDYSVIVNKFQIGSLLYWSGSRKNSNSDNLKMSSYTVLNLYASYRIDKEWIARLRVENAGDTNYELASGYNTPGRGVFASLQYQPK